jgi:flavin-dependent dehydrogenase
VTPADIRVWGAGPAGCAAARLLAQWGHQVVIVAPRPGAGPGLPESIPPSTDKLLEVLGLRDAFDAAAWVRTTGNTVWWGSDDARVEPFAGGRRGWQVSSDRLNAQLLAAARIAGARVIDGRGAVGDLDSGAFTLDCTGRAGVIGRRFDLRVHEPGPRTVALVARWQVGPRFRVADDSHTLIESYEDGWAWSVPLGPGERSVAVMVDPERSNLTRNRPAADVYDGEVAKTRRFRAMLSDARRLDRPSGWDASMYASRAYAGDTWLLVGDAASFVDPLSSAGVKKALASAWLAAVVVHTCVTNPAMGRTALAFYAQREADVYVTFRDLTRRYLTDAAAGHRHPFWTDRRDESEPSTDRGAVEAALGRLRSLERLALRRGPLAVVRDMPAVNGREIVLEPRIVDGTNPAGVRYVEDVDVIALADLASAVDTVPDLFDAYNRRAAPVSLPQFLTALATAVARGWLVVEGDCGTKN